MKADKVFIPVSVDERLPEVQTFYNCIVIPNERNHNCSAHVFFIKKGQRFSICPNDPFVKVTHWLQEKENVYVFTEEELRLLIVEAASECRNKSLTEFLKSKFPTTG